MHSPTLSKQKTSFSIPASPSITEPALVLLKDLAKPQTLRPRQRVRLDLPVPSTAIVSSGLLALRTTVGGRRVGVEILYTGDIVSECHISALHDPLLMAATVSTVWTLPTQRLDEEMLNQPRLGQYVAHRLATQRTRAALHLSIVAALASDERVASLLFEFALRLGRTDSNGILTVPLPLTREDAADHLALNADTVSRIMARLTADGVVERSSRSMIHIRDLKRLRDLTPLAHAIEGLHARNHAGEFNHQHEAAMSMRR